MKYKLELIVIAVISIGLSILLPSFWANSKVIIIPPISDMIWFSLELFIVISLGFFTFRKAVSVSK